MLFNQQKLIQKIVVVYCKTNGEKTFTQHGLYVKWIHSYFTHTQHVGMSLTGLFDIEYSNALCSGVTEASLFICAFSVCFKEWPVNKILEGTELQARWGKAGWYITEKIMAIDKQKKKKLEEWEYEHPQTIEWVASSYRLVLMALFYCIVLYISDCSARPVVVF